MKVKEVMTAKSLKTCSPNANVLEAAKTMKSSNCGALPVTDKSKKVVGIVTDRDICLSLTEHSQESYNEIPVSEVMEKKVYTVKESDDLDIALKQMRTHQVGRLPVVDKNGKLKGLISVHNLFSKALDGKTDIGKITAHGENIVKTVKALSDRYVKTNGKTTKTEAAVAELW